MSRPIDLTGIKVGRLTVLHRERIEKAPHLRWVCRCDCGKMVIREGRHLRDAVENNWRSACRACQGIGRRGRGDCCTECNITGHDRRHCPTRMAVKPRFCGTCWEQSWRRPPGGCPECEEPYAEEPTPSRLEFPHEDRTVMPL